MTPVRFPCVSNPGDHVVIAERIVRWERSGLNHGRNTRIVLDNGETITVGDDVDTVERKVREAGRS